MTGQNCMHVKVTATREELHDMGICSESTFELLLSGKAFAVVRREPAAGGKTMVHLEHPDSKSHLLWVFEEFTERVGHA